jgi:hypothetical protein
MNSQGNTQEKNNARGIKIPKLQTIFQSNSNKNIMVLAQNRHEDQWSRIEDPDMKPHNYTNLSLTKVLKIYDGENTASSTKTAGKTY